ncbi:MAG: sulfite exporter TauE/SafE family protein [Planctomycetes bacterium]|nr:sulfite exporter TauE/SafE family protein [Planctomycetota bacterium]
MNLTPQQARSRTLKAAGIAALAGMVSTMLGVGGGVVMVPLFALLGVMRVKRAAGTSLVVIVVVVAVGLAAQLIHEPSDVHWTAAGILAVGALAGTVIGEKLHKVLPEMPFRYAFCAVLILIGARMLNVIPETQPIIGTEFDVTSAGHVLFLVGVGLFAGGVGAMFGLGGGVVIVPMLTLAFAYFHDEFTATRATSLAVILPTSLLSAVLHWRGANVEKPLALRIMPLAALTSVSGVWLAYIVPQPALKATFAVLLLLATLRLMRKRKSPMPGESLEISDATTGKNVYTSPPADQIEGR